MANYQVRRKEEVVIGEGTQEMQRVEKAIATTQRRTGSSRVDNSLELLLLNRFFAYVPLEKRCGENIILNSAEVVRRARNRVSDEHLQCWGIDGLGERVLSDHVPSGSDRTRTTKVVLRWMPDEIQVGIPIFVTIDVELHGVIVATLSQEALDQNRTMHLAEEDVVCNRTASGSHQLECRTRAPSPVSRALHLALAITHPAFYLGPISLRYWATLDRDCAPFATSSLEVFNTDADSSSSHYAAGVTAAPNSNLQVRSIFGPRNGIFSSCTDPLTISVLFYLCLLFIALVVFAGCGSLCHSQDKDYSSWLDVPQWRSLLLQHSWLQLFAPCHRRRLANIPCPIAAA